MLRLYDITGDEEFRRRAERWQRYRAPRSVILPWRVLRAKGLPLMDGLIMAIAFGVPLALFEAALLLLRRRGRGRSTVAPAATSDPHPEEPGSGAVSVQNPSVERRPTLVRSGDDC